jgi:hypothetical protein
MAERTPDAGLVAEFATAERMSAALSRLRALGYSHLDTFSPFPVSGTAGALQLPRPPVAPWVLIAGSVGAVVAYLIQWYTNAWDYPLNVGGRPLMAIPAWIPIMVATGVLFGAVVATVGLGVLTRLPALWHPVFEVDGFERASVDRFWIVVGSPDPRFDSREAAELLRSEGALSLVRIGADG